MQGGDVKIIMGLDPGSHKTGFGVIEVGEGVRVMDYGVMDLSRRLSFPERLARLQIAIREVLAQYKPTSVAVEKIFFGKNADSAFKLGHTRGVCLVEVAQSGRALREYAARTVKKRVTGHGGASKDHVQCVVRKVLGLRETLREDASDALALALCDMYAEEAERVLRQVNLGGVL